MAKKKKARDLADAMAWINELGSFELAQIVAAAFGGLYANEDQEVDPDKAVSGADYVELMAGVLEEHGLGPYEDE